MHKVQRSILVPYAAGQMFELVDKVENYPQFMPWCGGVQVHGRDDKGVDASIMIQFAGLRQSFRTRNINQYPTRIDMQLVEGPFSALTGAWEFQALADDACKVLFTLDYEFSSRMIEAVIGPVFNRIATSFVDAFSQRAEACYGG